MAVKEFDSMQYTIYIYECILSGEGKFRNPILAICSLDLITGDLERNFTDFDIKQYCYFE